MSSPSFVFRPLFLFPPNKLSLLPFSGLIHNAQSCHRVANRPVQEERDRESESAAIVIAEAKSGLKRDALLKGSKKNIILIGCSRTRPKPYT